MSGFTFTTPNAGGGVGPAGPAGPPGPSMYSFSGFYIDSVLGNDLNDGTSPLLAFKTVARLLTETIAVNDIINVARGSYFREYLDLGTNNSIIIKDYGTGAMPVFDGADIAPNASFAATVGQAGVFQILWANDFKPGNPVQYSAWENGNRLKRATSLANCQATAGSFFWGSITQGGSDIIYIHATTGNVTTNAKLYEIVKREQGIYVGNSCKVFNMHTKRNGQNNGSFQCGQNSYCYRVIAEDGVKHNYFMESGLSEECVAWKSDDPTDFGGATVFVSYTNTGGDGTLDAVYRNCICLPGMNNAAGIQPGQIGLYSHTGGLPYRSVKVDGGYWTNCSVAIGGEAMRIEVKNANFYNNGTCVSKLNGTIVFEYNNVILPAIGDANPASCVSEDAQLDDLYFNNNKVVALGHSRAVKLYAGNPAFVQCNDNTLVGLSEEALFIVSNTYTGGVIQAQRNLMMSYGGYCVPISASSSIYSMNVAGIDNNCYIGIPWWSDYPKATWQIIDANPHYLEEVQALGFDLNSIALYLAANEGKFTGVKKTADYFVSKSESFYGKYGSESTYNNISRFGYNLFQLSNSLDILSVKTDIPENIERLYSVNTDFLNVFQYANFFQKINLHGLLDLADNAAAVAAGVAVGEPYRTGDSLKIVH